MPYSIAGNEVTLTSKLWPDVRADIWSVGTAWFVRAYAIGSPIAPKTQNFPTKEAALEHARIVLGETEVRS
jgi:hypothetical protein